MTMEMSGDQDMEAMRTGLVCQRLLYRRLLERDIALTVDDGALDMAAVEDRVEHWLALPTGKPRGVDVGQLPLRLVEVLIYLGVPLARGGSLRWGEHLMIAEVDRPLRDERGRLLLPPLDELLALTSLSLRPLRQFIAEHVGLRLQTASGISFHLWTDMALLVSAVGVPVGGFLYGPQAGQRHALAVPAGGEQVIRW